jgi:hypothetical protein
VRGRCPRAQLLRRNTARACQQHTCITVRAVLRVTSSPRKRHKRHVGIHCPLVSWSQRHGRHTGCDSQTSRSTGACLRGLSLLSGLVPRDRQQTVIRRASGLLWCFTERGAVVTRVSRVVQTTAPLPLSRDEGGSAVSGWPTCGALRPRSPVAHQPDARPTVTTIKAVLRANTRAAGKAKRLHALACSTRHVMTRD